MSSLRLILRYWLLGLLALLGVNLGWVVFIVVVDLFCGVRPQAAVPLFPAAGIGVILLLMVRALRRSSITNAQASEPSPPGHAGPGQGPSDAEISYPGRAILRSMLIVNRKRVSSASSVKGKVL
jgi:hypothetical protein